MTPFYDSRVGPAMFVSAVLRVGPRAGSLAGMAVLIEIVPVGVFSATYDLVAGGAAKGRIEHRILSLRDEASISTPGGTFSAHRDRVLRAAAVLASADGTKRATADRERFWPESYRVAFADRVLYLRRKPFSLLGMFLVDDESGEVGSIRLERPFSRRLAVEFAGSAPPLEIVAFLAWIVLMVQRRQASA